MKVFCAIDTPNAARAIELVRSLSGIVAGFKFGLEYFTALGPEGVRTAFAAATKRQALFLDLKFHDIPNTVAGAVASATALQPMFLTIHASGGVEMMRAAAQSATETSKKLGVTRPRLLAITVLTSLGDQDLAAVGQGENVSRQVERLASQASEAGIDGVVCSPLELVTLRKQFGERFVLVSPGVRPGGAAVGDQKRVMTPRQAMEAGADYLVIGRPITGAENPADAAQKIMDGR
ncbi:Orotidine 5'-phosphate decarboxylase [Azospirillaceae bacterium]